MYFGGNLNHGIGSVGDLPIPFDTVLNISGLVIVLTFVFLKVSWKESIFIEKEVFINSKQPLVGKFFGWVLLSLLIVPGLISDENANTSIAPLIVWVFFWIGVPVMGLFFGDVYAKFNPLDVYKTSNSNPKSV